MIFRRFLFVSLSFGLAFSVAAPVAAQQDNEWRPMLPSSTAETAPDRESGTEAAALRMTERQSASEQAQVANSSALVRVGSVLIDAKADLDHTMFDAAIEPFLGTEVSNDDLARLAKQIADVARSNGMVLASAYVPQQQVEMGTVRIVLRTGTIDEVRIQGSSNRALRQLLESLTGKTVMRGELERRLTLAGDIPEIIVRQNELLIEGDRQILLVTVEERKSLTGKLVADNFGSDNIGPLRARLTAEAVALFDDSDSANVTFRTNPVDPKELAAVSLSYGIALNNNGTRVEFSAAGSKSTIDPDGLIGKRNAQSQYASVAINHPLHRSRTSNLWIEGQFEYLKIDQDVMAATLQSDAVVTLSVGLSSSVKIGGGWLRTGVQLRQGLGILGATKANDPFASRGDADGQFTSARAWANWSGKPVGDMTLRVAVSGQMAAEPLLSSEEIGLGGAYVGRAFDFYERSGDEGILALAELGYDITPQSSWVKRIQPYVFLDGGHVRNLGSGFGGGTLISAGGGFRGDIGPIDFQLEAGIPVYATDYPQRDEDPAVNLQVGLAF
jgi:hemolysin activation/secretion protein